MANEIRIGIDKIVFEDNELGDIRTLKELSEGSHSAHALRHTEGGDDEIPGLVHPSGWISAGETWTYASPTTFTIVGDKTAKYVPGMKIKFTQTTAKYFYISSRSYSSPNTTITVNGAGLYTVANATITNPYYSTANMLSGFPIKMIPGYVKVNVYLGTDMVNIPRVTWVKVLLDTENYDTGSDFASNKFIAPVDGHYRISGSINYSHINTFDMARMFVGIHKNSAMLRFTQLILSADNMPCVPNLSCEIYLDKNDYIELHGYHDNLNNNIKIYNGENTSLEISLISII